jgi:hypothetical protein
MLYAPGGSVFSQQEDLGSAGWRQVLEFVRGGGGYVGVCAGALLAAQQGFAAEGADSDAGILGATTSWTGWEKDPGKPGGGKWVAKCTLTPEADAILNGGGGAARAAAAAAVAAATSSDGDHADGGGPAVKMVLSGGSWHTPAHHTNTVLGIDVPAFVPLCRFAAITQSDGVELPPETWGEAVPAVAGCFGAGRVVVFGPHPESASSDCAAHEWFCESVHWASRKGLG